MYGYPQQFNPYAYAQQYAPQYAPQYPQVGAVEIGCATPEEMALYQGLMQGAPQGGPEVGYWELGAGAPALMNPQAFNALMARPSPAAMPMLPAPMGRFAVTSKDPTTERVLFVGFKSSSTIAAAAAGTVESQPQDTFAPRKVVVPETVAPNFEITDIKIGSVSQLSSSDAIPAETFIPQAANTDVRFDTAQISQKITFLVTNISAAAATFRASMNGFVVRL